MFHQSPNLREGRQSIHHESSLPGGERSFEVVFPQRWGSENSKCAVQDPYSSDLILTPRGGTNLGFGFAETSQRCWVPPWGSLWTNPTSKSPQGSKFQKFLPAATNNNFPQHNQEISGLFSMIRPWTGWHPHKKQDLSGNWACGALQPALVLAQQFLPMIW